MNNAEYDKLSKEKSPRSPLLKDTVCAFLVGGGFCLLGQALKLLYQSWGSEEQTAGTLVSVSLVLLSAVLTGLGLYDKLAKHAGAGTLVPITGFANAVVSPAVEYKPDERDIIGLSRKAT